MALLRVQVFVFQSPPAFVRGPVCHALSVALQAILDGMSLEAVAAVASHAFPPAPGMDDVVGRSCPVPSTATGCPGRRPGGSTGVCPQSSQAFARGARPF